MVTTSPNGPDGSFTPSRRNDFESRISMKALHSFLFLLLSGAWTGGATLVQTTFVDPTTVQFRTSADPFRYFILQESRDLGSFAALELALGDTATVWELNLHTEEVPRSFFRVLVASLFAPLDSDGDLIDDLYELRRPGILNPLDPTDAQEDPDQNGLTHLDEYLRNLTGGENAPQYLSREVTAFNLGAPAEAALAREVTLFNLGSPSAPIEAISPEVSIYNGSGPLPYPQIPQAISRELTVYNLGSPSAPVEAISKTISVYNGSGPLPLPTMAQVISRETTVFNLGEPSAPVEAISREVSVLATVPNPN